MASTHFLTVYLLFSLILTNFADETVSKIDDHNFEIAKERRFLLYGVNPGEGFNLRRDVHMRAMNLVRKLRLKGENFILVLPPWGGLYHWQTVAMGDQSRIPWSTFFDLKSMNRFAPVIELERFLKENRYGQIDRLYYLQHYSEGWDSSTWTEKWDVRPCIEADQHYFQVDLTTGDWHGWFWNYNDALRANDLICVSVQGYSKTLIDLVLHKNNTDLETLMIDRFETVMHDDFGDAVYWQARRSMRYANYLIEIGNRFRENQLNSTDDMDQTIMQDDWTLQKSYGNATGGPYVSVHWRRRDFVRARANEIPSIKGTSEQIVDILGKVNLSTVFLATDAPKAGVFYDDFEFGRFCGFDVAELVVHLPDWVILKQYKPSPEEFDKIKDGGVSIVDQWIAAHARYFTGSYSSTLSYRIQEDREILGFKPDTTFNRLCPDEVPDCEQPAKWTMVL